MIFQYIRRNFIYPCMALVAITFTFIFSIFSSNAGEKWMENLHQINLTQIDVLSRWTNWGVDADGNVYRGHFYPDPDEPYYDQKWQNENMV